MTISWEYDLRNSISESTTETGEKQFVFNVEIIDYYLQTLTHLTRERATHIETQEDKVDIKTKTTQLIQVLDIILETYPNEVDVLMRSAYAHGISHNLSVEGAEDKAVSLYQQVLNIDPDNAKANFLLGMFIFGLTETEYDAEPYLVKALESGIDSCRFTLGMIYLQRNEREKGLEYISKFAADHPDNQPAQIVLKALQSRADSEGE